MAKIEYRLYKDCPYIPGQRQRSIYEGGIDYKSLARAFERYTPERIVHQDDRLARGLIHAGFGLYQGLSCEFCRACVPIRINLDKVPTPSKNKKRLLKKGDDRFVTFGLKTINEAISGYDARTRSERFPQWFSLYFNYIQARHRELEDNNERPVSDNVRHFTLLAVSRTHIMEFIDRQTHKPAILMPLAAGEESISLDAMYYDTGLPGSPGTYGLYRLIEEAQKKGFKYIYPHQWIKDHPKMGYKKNFPGLETMADGQWLDFDPEEHTQGPDFEKIIAEIPEAS